MPAVTTFCEFFGCSGGGGGTSGGNPVASETITVYKDEVLPVTVTLDEDTTSKTLRFVIERDGGVDVLVVEDGSITRTTTSFTVSIPATVTDEVANHTWSLRDISTGYNRVIKCGVFSVGYAASKDA